MNTSPCSKGFIVPGSTLMYGSSFCIVTRRPRDLSSRPRDEAVMPFPSDEATPPVTKMCLVIGGLPWAIPATRPREHTLPRGRLGLAHPVHETGPVDEQDQDGDRPRPVVEAEEQEGGDVEGHRHERVRGLEPPLHEHDREGELEGEDEGAGGSGGPQLLPDPGGHGVPLGGTHARAPEHHVPDVLADRPVEAGAAELVVAGEEVDERRD